MEESKVLRRAWDVLSEAFGLGYEMLHSMKFTPEKQTVVRVLAGDSLSHLIVGFRIALWGDLPESMSVLRGATESYAQLTFVVENQLYSVAAHELLEGRFNKIKFENVLRKLGKLGKAIAKTHGRISNVASHSTATRLAQAEYMLDGKTYDRFGFALDASSTELPTYHSVVVCNGVLHSIWKAHRQEDRRPIWEAKLLAVLKEGERLCTELISGAEQRNSVGGRPGRRVKR